MGKRPAKKRKIELVFDEKKRREYLSGFRQRKQERRKKARDDLELQVKEERKRLKLEAREDLKTKFKLTFAPIPELAELENMIGISFVKTRIIFILIDHLVKYLAMRLTLDLGTELPEDGLLNFCIYISPSPPQLLVLNGNHTLQQVNEKIWRVNKPMEMFYTWKKF